MKMVANTTVTKTGTGQAVWMLGGRYTVRVSNEDSGGELTVMEMELPVGSGPPPHTHPGGETVYVVEGTVRFHVGDKAFDAGAGDVIHIPAGTVEHFEPTSKSRVIVTYTPGGIDKFFLELGEPAPSAGLPPTPEGPPSPEFLERMATVGARYGVDIKV
jgi:quercetin dioxygenase-like cupin family protein